MRILWLAPLVLMAAACGTSAGTPSSWQRFDALRPQLDTVSRQSAALALDASRIRSALSEARSRSVRRWTSQARVDAQSLSLHAGSAGNRVESLVVSAPRDSAERRYLVLVLDTLRHQWVEGQRMATLAALLWNDPLLVSQRNEASFAVLQRQAAASARIAVADVVQANALRRKDSQAFRYVPVRLAGGLPGSG